PRRAAVDRSDGAPAAGHRGRDAVRDRHRPPGARLGGGRRAGGGAQHDRSGLSALARRPGDRLHPPARPAAAPDADRLPRLVCPRRAHRPRTARWRRRPLAAARRDHPVGHRVILPILKDAHQAETPFGQVVIAGASIAEVGPIVLLSLFFSGEAGGLGSKLALLIAFMVFVAAVGAAILGLERSTRITRTLVALQDTTAEIRVRAAFLLLIVFALLASKF